jgi:hypothetical protein
MQTEFIYTVKGRQFTINQFPFEGLKSYIYHNENNEYMEISVKYETIICLN